MSDHKVFVFGSFTEDEARLFQNKSAQKSCVCPSEKEGAQHASTKTGTIKSLDIVSLNSVKSLGTTSKQTASAVRSRDIQSTNSIGKGTSLRNGKSSDSQHTKSSQENEILNGHSSNSSSGSKMDTLDISLVHISEIRCGDAITPVVYHTLIDRPADVNDDGFDGSMNNNNNKFVEKSTDVRKKLNEQASPAKILLPRGLINSGNLCFLNATIQALLSCSPFVQLLHDLANRNVPKNGYPTLGAFVEFISGFEMSDDPKAKNHERQVPAGEPFGPIMFDPILEMFTPDLSSSLSGWRRQEDAQEFLSFLMDRMHDELLKLEGHLLCSNGRSLPLVSSSEDDGWETVGRKNKTAVTRTQSFSPSQLSTIFGGQLRSVVKARGIKASATVQPFLLLHLDILPNTVCTIEDALRLFSAPEELEGYKASAGTAAVVSASKSVQIQTLPKILILHLMRFSYGSSGSTKLRKPVHFPLELVLARDLLVIPSSEGRKYELVATVTHHGQQASMGHYTADSKHSNGQWLRYNDSYVTAVGMSKVLHGYAYILFYKQM